MGEGAFGQLRGGCDFGQFNDCRHVCGFSLCLPDAVSGQ
jgi:hypothetical protein